MKTFLKRTLALLLVAITVFSIPICGFAASVPTVKYRAHVQSKGWLSWVTNGKTAGTTGQVRRMEGIKIILTSGSKSMVTYQAHVTDYGWQAWKNSGSVAGITGKSKSIEAVKIKLTGTYAKRYDIYYRVHVPYKGWLGWAKNGSIAGSTGMRIRTEALQIKLVKKGSSFKRNGVSSLVKPALSYQTNVQKKGWLGNVAEGKISGTTGQGLGMGALRVKFTNFEGKAAIQYRVHLSGSGWRNWQNSGNCAGSTSQKRTAEAFQVRLTGGMEQWFDVYYRAHVQKYGWLGWAKNGEVAGTTGASLRLEAVQIKVIPKESKFDRGGLAQYNFQWLWPVPSSKTINQHFGENGHEGLDIGGALGCNVLASMAGRVIYAREGDVPGAYYGGGRFVVIEHVNGYYSHYAHLNSICVSEGQLVKQGQRIGTMGSTGVSTGVHLHFAIATNSIGAGGRINNNTDTIRYVDSYLN